MGDLTLFPAYGSLMSQAPAAAIGDAGDLTGFIDAATGKRVSIPILAELVGSGTAGTSDLVISRGARGTVWDVQVGTGVYTYMSDQDDGSYPYRCRSDLSISGQVLDTGDGFIEVVVNYGQSWVTNSSVLPPNFPAIIVAPTEITVVFAPVNSPGNFAKNIGLPISYTSVTDFNGVTAAGNGNQLGKFTSINRVRQMRRQNLDVKPIWDICPAYPGLIWPGLQPGTGPWTALVAMVAMSQTLAAKYGKVARFRMIRWTDGVNVDYATEISDLTAFLAALDAVPFNPDGTKVIVFGDQTPADCLETQVRDAVRAQVDFALANPARYVNVGPRYAYTNQDYIHHDAMGSGHLSDIRSFVEVAVLEQGLTWTVLHIAAIYVVPNGNGTTTITIDTNQPLEGFFGQVSIDTTYIEADVQLGFRLKQNGNFISISNIAVVPVSTRLTMTVAANLAQSDTLEFSYAYYGPGKPAGTHAGCWGNICMYMADSLFFAGQKITAWLAISLTNLSAANFGAPPALPAISDILISATTLAAGQAGVDDFATLTAITTGTVGAITWSMINDAGGYFSIDAGNSLQAIAALPAGTFSITVQAVAVGMPAFRKDFSIVAS